MITSKRTPFRTHWALLGLLLLGLALRLIALQARPLWYDEAFAVLFSEKGLAAMIEGTITPTGAGAADIHPLLYYTLLGGWMNVVGQTPFMVRLFNVIVGMVTLLTAYGMARDMFGERVALAALGVLAVAPFVIQYHQEARMYALLGLWTVSATLCVYRGLHSDHLRYWVAFGVLAALCMYTQALASVYLLALGLVPLVFRRRDLILKVAMSAAIGVLLYLPWLVNLSSQVGKLSTYWVARPTLAQPLLTLWVFLFVELPIEAAPILLISIGALAIVLIVLVMQLRQAARRQRTQFSTLMYLAWLTSFPIIALWLISQWRPVYVIRGLFPSALMFLILVGWLFMQRRVPSMIRYALVGVWLVTVGLGLYYHYTWRVFPRPPFDQADVLITSRLAAGGRIVHANKLTMLPMFYYDRALPQTYIRDVPNSGEDTLALATQRVLGLLAKSCMSDAVEAAPQVWFVILDKHLKELGGTSPDLTWLDQHYKRIEVVHINDLQLYRYEQPDAAAGANVCEGTP